MKWLKGWKWILAGIAVVALAWFSGRADGGDGDSDSDDGPKCTVEVIADDLLNVRDGPGTDHSTVDQLEPGTVVDAEPETSNGFRKLDDDRWVASEFVKASKECTAPSE